MTVLKYIISTATGFRQKARYMYVICLLPKESIIQLLRGGGYDVVLKRNHESNRHNQEKNIRQSSLPSIVTIKTVSPLHVSKAGEEYLLFSLWIRYYKYQFLQDFKSLHLYLRDSRHTLNTNFFLKINFFICNTSIQRNSNKKSKEKQLFNLCVYLFCFGWKLQRTGCGMVLACFIYFVQLGMLGCSSYLFKPVVEFFFIFTYTFTTLL